METKDKSPSLVLGSEELSEMMHNSHGAFAESLYIYESALIEAHKKCLPLSVYSLGLGLAYNEWISIGYSIKHQLEIRVQTSESELWLYEVLENLVYQNEQLSGYRDVKLAMEQVLQLVARHYNISIDSLINKGLEMLQSNKWSLNNSLSSTSLIRLQPVSVIFYDAFSKKMSPELWTEEFLIQFLDHMSGQSACVLSTYACTGALKRALKTCHFKLISRTGFQGKRESTLAIKTIN